MSAPVTEAHRKLTLAITGHTDSFEYYARLIADSEAKATVELKKQADHWCDMHTVCAKERDQLRAELEKVYALVTPDGCDLAPRGLFETARAVTELRAEVKESKARERAAIASWDEERQRALREGGRVVELRAEVRAILEIVNEQTARAESAEAEVERLREWQAGVIENERLHHAERKEAIARAESAEREVEEQCLLNGKGAEREASLIGKLERAEREIEQKRNLLTVAIKSAGDQAARAERAEAEVDQLKDGLRDSEAALALNTLRAERAEAELANIRALANRRNKRDHSQDTTHQLVVALDQALDIAQAELATEREKVRVLRSACESICEEWGKNHDAPFCAGSEMEKLAAAALAATEDAQ